MNTGLYIAGIGIVIMIIIFVWAFDSEKRQWNNGVCPHCHSTWKRFDTDSQGGRGYKCACPRRRYIWISWPVDKRIAND